MVDVKEMEDFFAKQDKIHELINCPYRYKNGGTCNLAFNHTTKCPSLECPCAERFKKMKMI